MRKIDVESSAAFWNNRNYSNSNTSVHASVNVTSLVLHNNCIAKLQYGSKNLLIIDNKGYDTVTKNRLNAVLEKIGYGLYQKDFKWYLFESGYQDEAVLFTGKAVLFTGKAVFNLDTNDVVLEESA